jgi:hypothetical protein
VNGHDDSAWTIHLDTWLTQEQIDFLDNSRGLKPFRGIGSKNANYLRAICDQLIAALAEEWKEHRATIACWSNGREEIDILRAALCAIRDNRAWVTADDCRVPASRALAMGALRHDKDCTCAYCLPEPRPLGYGA